MLTLSGEKIIPLQMQRDVQKGEGLTGNPADRESCLRSDQ
jgi:hypothetical protein